MCSSDLLLGKNPAQHQDLLCLVAIHGDHGMQYNLEPSLATRMSVSDSNCQLAHDLGAQGTLEYERLSFGIWTRSLLAVLDDIANDYYGAVMGSSDPFGFGIPHV